MSFAVKHLFPDEFDASPGPVIVSLPLHLAIRGRLGYYCGNEFHCCGKRGTGDANRTHHLQKAR
ncbi:uncharacterized protein BO88DRAFT_406365 [Aspergillus vadensis CBS 113365]|uniref:Uncharacterized protein n=1 Tax=Aspergillus vadensis (strain CBS 113365 / IMI 142717 / IBT 24658) TaxID=1448311 RepID=A0A319B327_ASPVC|nr:hypothetical protein BO88DRAFT_406365 [Aspergillus vadensis CBS 113365]PYH67137.1 hypothetical protein BO88DRAFT_406365 [Aspergillus vadensis CBS 113365]